jgi:hypothetical protein
MRWRSEYFANLQITKDGVIAIASAPKAQSVTALFGMAEPAVKQKHITDRNALIM